MVFGTMGTADDPLECGLKGGETLHQHWNSEFILLSMFVSEVGAYTSIAIMINIRHVISRWWYAVFLSMAGVAFGYSTVWCMHFIGMKGLTLRVENPETVADALCEVRIRFDVMLTAISALVVWGTSMLAFHLVAGRRVGRRGRLDIDGICRLLMGSVLIALGCILMHYMGMFSQVGHFHMHYKVGVVLLSAIVAIIAATCGLSILIHFPPTPFVRLAASCVISLAVNSMHYIGMFSASYTASTDFVGVMDGGHAINISAALLAVSSVFVNQLLFAVCARYDDMRKDTKSQVLTEAEYAHHVRRSGVLLDAALTPRFPMVLLALSTFRAQGRLRLHEELRNEKLLVFLDCVNDVTVMLDSGAVVLFFSHQWLDDREPDPHNEHYAAMLKAADECATLLGTRDADVYIWVDYSCVPQRSLASQQLAIDSIGFYTAMCSAFIIIAPPATHTSGHAANYATYGSRLWCRFECLSKLLGVCCAPASAISHQLSSLSWTRSTKTPSARLDSQEEPCCEQMSSGHYEVVRMGVADAGIFVVDTVDGPMRSLSPWEQDTKGASLRLRTEFQNLCYCYEGALTCCSRGHFVDGVKICCDKKRLVEVLVGLYGLVLRKVFEEGGVEEPSRSNSDSAHQWGSAAAVVRSLSARKRARLRRTPELCKAQAIKALASDDRMFPKRYFGSRIEAMEEFLLSTFENPPTSPASSKAEGVGSCGIKSLRTEIFDERDMDVENSEV